MTRPVYAITHGGTVHTILATSDHDTDTALSYFTRRGYGWSRLPLERAIERMGRMDHDE